MEKRFLSVLRDAFIMVTNYIPLMLAYLVLKGLICRELKMEFSYVAGISILVPISLFYVYREVIKPGYLQLIAHVATAVLCIFLFHQDMLDAVLLTIANLGIMAYSLYLRFKDAPEKTFHPLFITALMIIEYLCAFGNGCVSKKMVALCMVIAITAYYIQFYLGTYFWFIISRKSVNEAIPEKEILNAGVRYTGVFMLLTVLGLVILSQIEMVEKWAHYILGFMKELLRILLAFIFGLFPKESTSNPMLLETPEQANDVDILMMDTKEQNPIWQIIFNIFAVIMVIVVILGIIYLVKKGFTSLLNALNKEKSEHQFLEEKIEKEYTEKVKVDKRKQFADSEGFLFLSPAQKIRKMYRQVILANGRNSIFKEKHIYQDKSKTTNELLEIFDKEKETEARELTSLYELARYDKNAVSQEQVKRVKELTKRL